MRYNKSSMPNKKVEKPIEKIETPAPEVKPDAASAAKPTTKKPALSKFRKMLIIFGSISIGLGVITLIIDGMSGSGSGTIEIIMVVLFILAVAATEVFAYLTYKKEPEKKALPLTCLIICSIALVIALIFGVIMIFEIG